MQPFANTLVSMTLTGAQIESVLEEQWQPCAARHVRFLKLGISAGFTYTYDPLARRRLSASPRCGSTASPIDPAATYVVGMNSFLASGGDNFVTFRQGTNKADSGKVDLESMVAWFDEFENAEIDLQQRAVGVNLPGGSSAAAGASVTVNLSSLDFTRDEIDADFAVVSSGGVELGSAAVDTAYTPTVDEVGKATVAFTVPLGASGPTTFDVTVPSTGTTSSFVLNVTP